MGLTRPLLPLSRAAMLIATAFIGACASVQPKSAAVAFNLPPEFVTENQAAYSASDFWWHAFGDARLDAFVNTALEKNPGLAQALARSRMAEAQVRLTAADPLPQIGIGAGSSRGRQNMPNLAGHTAPIIGSNYDVALDVSWELDMWGRLSALTASARADYLASTEQLRGMRQSVAAQAVQRYFEIVHAYAQVELSERTTEALGEMARQINNRIDVGITSPADGMLANANLESARAGLEQRREGLERSLRQLQILMGDYPSGNVDTALSLPMVPSAPAGGVPAELLARRPDGGWPSGLEYTITQDEARQIWNSLFKVFVSALQTMAIVFAILLLTIAWREAVVAGLSVPITFAGVLLAILVMGYSLNELVVIGMVIALVMIVDVFILLMEGLHDEIYVQGKTFGQGVLATVKRYAMPAFAAQLTTILALVPLMSIGGTVGEFIRVLPATAVVCLVISFIVATYHADPRPQ